MKKYCALLVCVVFSSSLQVFSVNIEGLGHDEWERPFLDAINKFQTPDRWVTKSINSRDFSAIGKNIWSFLKRKSDDWMKFLNPSASEQHFDDMPSRGTFNSYVKNVFLTKPGTLIFRLNSHPDIVVKIDNRPPHEFDEKYRSYAQAFKKTQAVQKRALPTDFDHLYLPMETLISSKEKKVDVVMSERVPLFSEADIDNRILLHFFLSMVDKNLELKNRLRIMYSQAVTYICQGNYDDIKPANIPFTIDGRLAPFDTDQGLAQTGVHSFMQQFFGYRLLSLSEVKSIIQTYCPEPYASNPQNIEMLYNNHGAEDTMFSENQKMIERVERFFRRSGSMTKPKLAFMVEKSEFQAYAKKVDDLLEQLLEVNKHLDATLFGRRCVHINDFANLVTRAFKDINPKIKSLESDKILQDLLRIASFNGVTSLASLPKKIIGLDGEIAFFRALGELSDLRSYLCF